MSFFGKNLAFIRKQRKLLPADFALVLGIWEDTLRNYEKNRAEPDMDTLLSIGDALQMPLDHLLRRDLEQHYERLRSLRPSLILLDVDGTLTDGGMYYTESGDRSKRFDTKDGLVIHRLIKRQGVQFGFISSGSTETIVRQRAETLGVQRVYTGTRPKVEVVSEWLEELKIGFDRMAFVGDDLNDLPLLKRAGLSACPADAVAQVRAQVDVVLSRRGGYGAVRELLEDIMGYDVAD
ncbi:MAG: hypothetical protein OHK0039_40050 [Bacteroidia bacterium]